MERYPPLLGPSTLGYGSRHMRRDRPENLDLDRFKQNHYYYWHQEWEVFPGIITPGRSSVDDLLKNAGVPENLKGKQIADIGAWNGCVAFECERRGAAEVVAVSLEDPEWSGFNYLKDVLASERTRYQRVSIYDLDPGWLGTFDIVICFGVLYHLRYPVLGIDNLRRISAGDLYLETHVLDHAFQDLAGDNSITTLSDIDERLEGAALIQFYKGKELQGGASNWFSPSMSAVVGLLETAGFEVTKTRKNAHRGYFAATVNPGLPPFIDQIEGEDTYEGLFYDLSFNRMFGPRERWRR
jgi:tRNA (mo5U34)-methyltransferase